VKLSARSVSVKLIAVVSGACARQVHLDRLLGHEQGLRDLAVREPVGGHARDAGLAGGQPAAALDRAAARRPPRRRAAPCSSSESASSSRAGDRRSTSTDSSSNLPLDVDELLSAA
jgi:hypothetical protein